MEIISLIEDLASMPKAIRRLRSKWRQWRLRKLIETAGMSNRPLYAIGRDANKSCIYKQNRLEANRVTAWTRGGTTDASNYQTLAKRTLRQKATDNKRCNCGVPDLKCPAITLHF